MDTYLDAEQVKQILINAEDASRPQTAEEWNTYVKAVGKDQEIQQGEHAAFVRRVYQTGKFSDKEFEELLQVKLHPTLSDPEGIRLPCWITEKYNQPNNVSLGWNAVATS